jgi:peptide/nickel transport system ATP-binding protein
MKSDKDKPLLEIRDLRIDGFSEDRWHPIIKGIDLSIRRGEVLGLIGESGAGKSTLGLAAMGYTRPGCRITGGSITFDGMDVLSMSELQRRALRGHRITYVAQSAAASFNPAHRLLDQTVESVYLSGKTDLGAIREDARGLYRAFQLPNPETIGDRFPHQVSGGQLQRVMTAMAMISRPDLIIFDEPTTALDVTTQVEVLATMRKAVTEFNTAAVYITHDLAVVAQMADRIKVLRYGEEIEEAETRTMLSIPKYEYTRSLWSVRALEKQTRTNDDIILSIKGVDAAYGTGPKVLDSVNIDIPRGTTVSVVGESGSGKSTTARVITGLLPPSKGEVRFNGAVLPAKLKLRNKDQLRRIQMIYQSADTAINPHQTIRDIIGRPLEFYLGLKGPAKSARIAELMTLIELDPVLLDRLPGALSGGQKQRVCIARALAAEPDLIICDEVTSALDQIVQEGILKLLMRLQKELGVSYLFITHDISTVRAISDRVVVMNKGHVVEAGTKEEVFSPPHPDYTELLLASVPEMDPDWLTHRLSEQGGVSSSY